MSSLGKRTISGTTLILGMLLAAYFAPAWGIFILLAGIAVLASGEFYSMMDSARLVSFRYLGMLSGVALIAATFFSMVRFSGDVACATRGVETDGLVMGLIVLAVMARQFPQKYNAQPILTMACTLFGILYVPFLFNFVTKLAFAWEPFTLQSTVSPTGRILCLYLIIVVKATDTGAFLVGSSIGRHKMFPRVSPGKTWEGLVGGIAGGLIASLAFYFFLRDGASGESWAMLGTIKFHLRDALVLGLLMTAAGTVGDLAESLIKRGSGLKDSGATIPGMGGILDILDSLLFGAPILYFYVRLFLQ